MTFSADAIDVSYDFCRQTARLSGSNFSGCFFGLPKTKRRAMDALYAFMRHTDDLADDLADDPRPVDDRRLALSNWRTALAHALDGRPDTPGQLPGRDLLPAVADAVERFSVPSEYLRAVIDGVQMDLTINRYETFAELEVYCEKVASAVGLACIHVWGFRGREALEPARKCGIALQLTNVLRDLKEDARRDRVYLPLADLRQCDYTVDDLLAGVADERFEKLMDFEIGRAEWYYRKGAELMDWLEPGGRRIFGMMMSTYRALLQKILRRPRAVLAGRVRLSRPKKLQIAARWTLLPPRAAALL